MSDKPRPVGNAGRGGRHDGKKGVGWLGGQHRKQGCLSAALVILGVGVSIVGGLAWGAVELVRVVAF